MNEYLRPTDPDPQLPQAPQTSGAYPNQPQNQYGQNQPVNSQISQPYMQNPAHQAAPSPSTPPESAVKPKMSILLLAVLILAILMPILRVIEYGVYGLYGEHPDRSAPSIVGGERLSTVHC